MDPTYPLYPVFTFLGFLLVLIPLPWHLQSWNSGTCFYMMWASIACLNQFVNSVVWHGNALNTSPIWCEISIRIIMGASVGLPAASLCINRRLYSIASVRAVNVTRAEKSRAILIDSLICVLFPILYITWQYVIQGHRFNVLEDIGCYPALYNTLLAYFLSGMWPILIGLISMVYCILSLRCFVRQRIQFNQFLSANKSLTVSRYFRLMALSMTEIAFTTPLAIFAIVLNATASPVGPWRSWEDTHFRFSRVDQIPAVIWRSNHLVALELEFSRWVTPLCALIFFAFFGFADEAKKHYKLAFWAVVKPFGLRPPSEKQKSGAASIGQYKPKSYPMVSTTTSSLPPYSPPSSSSTQHFHDKKRPVSLVLSLPESVDDTYTQFSSPSRTSVDTFADITTTTPTSSQQPPHSLHHLNLVPHDTTAGPLASVIPHNTSHDSISPCISSSERL
ncbi:Pheromone B alpha 3 receptor [Hypsizygus marmoreus]|uniref:Pheromone B alpha 3 receptor n=1 Tax=Hypsizygus marmoreus TaxID=39966 RepID=A0A369JFU5_HYPMA|nr:Pheromone B alpha 3 receptor [Hypsizygus marmoreus]